MCQPDCNLKRGISFSTFDVAYRLAAGTYGFGQTIGRIERGERNPSLEIAIRLAHYLKVPVEDIFQIED